MENVQFKSCRGVRKNFAIALLDTEVVFAKLIYVKLLNAKETFAKMVLSVILFNAILIISKTFIRNVSLSNDRLTCLSIL